MTIDEAFRSPCPANPCADSTQYVLYGAGLLGQYAARELRSIGIQPLAFCDSDSRKWDAMVEGVMVMPLTELMIAYPKAVYVVTIYHGASMRDRLRGMGLTVASFAQLHRARLLHRKTGLNVGGPAVPYASLDDPDEIRKHREAIETGYGLWADDASREEYAAQVRYRLTLDDACLPPSLPEADIYFPPEIPWKDKECFVDCGAFDGDTVRAFVKRRPPDKHRDSIIAIEPDPDNWRKLMQQEPGAVPQMRVVQAAVGDKPGKVAFKNTGTAGSCISEEGGYTVNVRTLDDILNKEFPTRIKMDIEGSELSALIGGTETIHKHKPALAVCLYHKASDLWTIPAYVKEVLPDYKLYLRRYCDDCWELVMYAVKE